ncbi:MAG: glycoside hydrolase family 88 protein [Bacteroidales bacterium]|nr:glycoside hydrolase family 88 protein [Bacteroidales bacterium]
MIRRFSVLILTFLAAAWNACGGDVFSSFRHLPPEADPVRVGDAIAAQFLSTDPAAYAPEGYDGTFAYGWDKYVTYPVLSLWINALEFAHNSGNDSLQTALISCFEPFYGPRKHQRSVNNHVDHSIFGALPLEIFVLTGDERARDLGLSYADRQWSAPVEKDLGGNGNFDYETQLRLFADGYSPQTRFWIDDMYMINTLQTQAYRATGEEKYLDRAAREMVLYLDTLQLAGGLFYHAPDVPFVWGRGDGWMAAAMPVILRYLPRDHACRARIEDGYRLMMETLLDLQRESGLWGQLVNDPQSWDESSGSAMFTFALVEGIRLGLLAPRKFGPAARKAWVALCAKLDGRANIADVCVGTNRYPDRDYYLSRPRFNGDPHGQAAMMWVANALLSGPGREPLHGRKRRTGAHV